MCWFKLGNWVEGWINVFTFGFGKDIAGWIAWNVFGKEDCGCEARRIWLNELCGCSEGVKF